MNYLNLFPYILSPSSHTDEQIKVTLRQWRNEQLAASDWTQLPDVDIANKWDWAVYRQALRDMMAQNVDPKLIVFPTPPA